jgi:hypothetical protein
MSSIVEMTYVILNLASLYQTTVTGFADPTNVFFTKRPFSASLLIEGTVGMLTSLSYF